MLGIALWCLIDSMLIPAESENVERPALDNAVFIELTRMLKMQYLLACFQVDTREKSHGESNCVGCRGE